MSWSFVRGSSVSCCAFASLVGVDEPGTAAAGPQGRVDHGPHPRRTLVVEHDLRVLDAVRVRPHPERACLEPGQEPSLRTFRVQPVPQHPCRGGEILDRALGRHGDQLLGREPPRLHCGIRAGRRRILRRGAGGWVAEAAENRVHLRRRHHPAQQRLIHR
ncbi:hypothetical protein, partial [Microbacterium petrolearium]